MQRIDRPNQNSIHRSQTKAGSVAVEFLLTFPVAFIFLLGIVEFGLFLTNLRHVDDAAFQAARAVSKLERNNVPQSVGSARQMANRVLQTAGIGPSCVVVVEHNVPRAGSHRQIYREPGCDVNWQTPGQLPRNDDVAAVRCTVIVPMRHLAPDLLSWVGFSLNQRYTRSTVTLPYTGNRGRFYHGGNGHGSHGKKPPKKKKK